jgi:macrolide transport system ATP-binding/permease protein
MMRGLVRDMRYGLRAMRNNPGFTSVVVVTLALGIGANTSIFSLLSALVLRPIPGVAVPAGLVELHGDPHDLSYPDVADLRAAATLLSRLAARKPWGMDLRIGGETLRVRGALVGCDYFSVLGVVPVYGRAFLPDEEAGSPGSHPVAVIGYALWHDRFGADPRAIGAAVGINGHPFTVIGIAPEGFRGVELLDGEEIWVPLDMYHQVAPGLIAGVSERWPRWLSAVGRLKPGGGVQAARAQIETIARRMAQTYREDRDQRVKVAPLREAERSFLAGYLALLNAIVGAVLLIACANVAGLLLARGSGRRREIAIRAALGAGQPRLIGQLLIESLVLAAAGAAAGLLLTLWTAHALRLWLVAFTEDFPPWLSLAPDARVLGLAAALTAVSVGLFGATPAIQLSRPDLITGLKERAPAGALAGTRFRKLLVAFQVALSVVLLVGAGLMIRTLRRQWESTPALAPEQVLQVTLEPAAEGYDPARAKALYAQLVERVEALPGVTAVALARNRLPWDNSFFDETVTVEGSRGSDNLLKVKYDVVTHGYFHMIGRALQRGRDFTVQDREGSMGVAIINATLARRLWPGADPLGRRFRLQGEREVIGVADDRTPYGKVPQPFVYLPLTQRNPWPDSPMTLHLRTAGDPAVQLPAVRREVAALEPDLPPLHAHTLAESVRSSDGGAHLASMVLGTAGVLALALSAIGLYGLIAYSVAQRVPEFGIRRALGAGGADLLFLVMRDGMIVICWGLVIGVVVAVAATPRIVQAFFFDMGLVAADPLTVITVVLALAATGLTACLVPARRALRVDPAVALRAE